MEILLGFRGNKEVRVFGVMVGDEEGGLRTDWTDPGWSGHLETGQSDLQGGNREKIETHLGLKRMPFLEKGTGLHQPKNLGRACEDWQWPSD